MTLHKKIYALRKQRGWSQEQLAERLGVTRQALSKWELGTAIPDTVNIMKLCDLFGVSADALLDDSRELSPPSPLPEKGLSPKAKTLIAEKGPVACRLLALGCLPGLLVFLLILGGYLGVLSSLGPLSQFPPPAFFLPGAAAVAAAVMLGKAAFYLYLGHKLHKSSGKDGCP